MEDTASRLPRGERLRLALFVGLGQVAVRLLGASLRLTEVNREPLERLRRAGEPVIYAVWHGRMLMLPYFYGRELPAYVLASRSRDGELVAGLARAFGLRAVRGSTSRGAATALRALVQLVREERAAVAVIPDGPRGPRHRAQPGAVMLAKLGGAAIVPVGFGASAGLVLRSWDAFLVPRPFARAAVVFGDPLRVPGDADRAALETWRQTLEQALTRVTQEADRVAAGHVPPL